METKNWKDKAKEPASEVDLVGKAKNSAPDAADDAVEAISAAINKNSVSENERQQ
jgi:hypothetical protein